MTNAVAGSVGEDIGIIYIRYGEAERMICLECLFRNRPEAAVCQQCGRPLVTGCRFAVPSASGSRVIVVPLPPAGEIVIGREDAVAGIFPDLDTSALKDSAGVSRRHVRLRRRTGR